MPTHHHVLVTGSAGAIGQPVCRELTSRDHTVRGFDVRETPGVADAIVADLTDREAIAGHLEKMAAEVARWLGRHRLFARTVTIKVRYSDFTTITRSQSAERPTSDEGEMGTRAVALLEKTEAGRRPVRLLGVSAHNLTSSPEPVPRRTPRRDDLLPFSAD